MWRHRAATRDASPSSATPGLDMPSDPYERRVAFIRPRILADQNRRGNLFA